MLSLYNQQRARFNISFKGSSSSSEKIDVLFLDKLWIFEYLQVFISHDCLSKQSLVFLLLLALLILFRVFTSSACSSAGDERLDAAGLLFISRHSRLSYQLILNIFATSSASSKGRWWMWVGHASIHRPRAHSCPAKTLCLLVFLPTRGSRHHDSFVLMIIEYYWILLLLVLRLILMVPLLREMIAIPATSFLNVFSILKVSLKILFFKLRGMTKANVKMMILYHSNEHSVCLSQLSQLLYAILVSLIEVLSLELS